MKMMYAAHSGWRWLVLLAVLAAIGLGLQGWLAKRPWSDTARKVMLATAIVIDIQLLLGIGLYIAGKSWQNPLASVKFAHPFMMFLALFAVHGVYRAVKGGKGDEPRYKAMALGTLAVLAVIVLGVASLPGNINRLFSMTSMG